MSIQWSVLSQSKYWDSEKLLEDLGRDREDLPEKERKKELRHRDEQQ